VTADPREKGLGRFDRQRLRLGHLQRDPRGSQTRPLVVCGKQAVVADAFEAARQHVLQEAADEGVDGQGDGALGRWCLIS